MKKYFAILLASLTALASFAADAVPSFNATLTVGSQNRFVLIDTGGKSSSWLKLGDTFEGYTLKSYDAKTFTLGLEHNGTVTPVKIVADAALKNGGSALPETPATLEDATQVLNAMHFEKMLDRTMAAMKKQQMAMVGQMINRLAKPGTDNQALIAFQQKLIDTMMSAVSGADLKQDVAKLYSEVFTREELQGLASFYSSPVGESFSDKQPILAAKMNALIMPRMMSVMPKIQQMAQEFKAQQAEAHRAAQAGSAAPAAAAPAVAPAGSGTK